MYRHQLCVTETLLFIQVTLGIAIRTLQCATLGTFLRKNSAKMIALGLAAQATAGYAAISDLSRINSIHIETVADLNEVCLKMGYRANFTPSATCNVSQEEVDEVVNIINQANTGLIIDIRNPKKSAVSSMDQCQLALVKIKEGAQKLKEDIGKLKSNDGLSEADFRKLEKSYRDDIRELRRQWEIIKRQVGQGQQSIVIKLEIVMQTFQQNSDTSVNELESTRRELRENKIRLCVSEIGANEIKSAVKIFKELNDNHLLERIINAAYNNLENLLKFIRDLHDWQQWSMGYPALLNEMKSKNDLNTVKVFMLAYSVREVMAGKYGINSDIPQKFGNTFKVLKKAFPDAVQSILWDTVCIKNKQFKEYLYAPLNDTFDDDRRNVFTWTKKDEVDTDGIWILEALEEGRSFTIKNHRRNELFYAADHQPYDDERRRVFTWRQEDDGSHAMYKWVLEPINAEISFQIKSVYQNEYMYAVDEGSSFKGEKRRVVTWRHKGESAGSQGVWNIIPCHPVQYRCKD